MPSLQSVQQAIETYYRTLNELRAQNVINEGGLRRAFSVLLADLGRAERWTLVEEQTLTGRIRPDGTLRDDTSFPRGHWEAKDSADDLEAEIRRKIERGYPLNNIIFEDGRRAILYQNRRRVSEADMLDRVQLSALLTQFFGHTEQHIEEFHRAVEEFKERIPDLASGLEQRIEQERGRNQRFTSAFESFHELCRQAVDPKISADAIEKMLVQHLLTERLFRTVFDDPDFTRRNVIADEIERVIRTLTWNRSEFLRQLDPFYRAIEHAARDITDFAEKQTFMNSVYERFFQGYSKAQADTHGIVYTPQPIVDFMIASVDEILQREFDTSLSSEGVVILDPCTGTGNFVVNILRRISRRDLKRKYREELFANEIMLLAYYIASLNIEHTYQELTGEHLPFEGICFADTLDLADAPQLNMFAEENTERVARQKQAPITVIIGNPPYNVGQVNENDNNKNRRYDVVDERIAATYVKASEATLKRQLYDAYVRFFRWATDRLNGDDGIVCYVTNNSFIDQKTFDGMRKHLHRDFDQIYHLDLHGNVRQNPKLSGTTHNVFGIQIGVGVTIAVRRKNISNRYIKYFRVPENWTKAEKLEFIENAGSIDRIDWKDIIPNAVQAWLIEGLSNSFDGYMSIGEKSTKRELINPKTAIFKEFYPGVNSSRDVIVYDHNIDTLLRKVQSFIERYNTEIDRWKRSGSPRDIDNFVDYLSIKWSENLKRRLISEDFAHFNQTYIRKSLYRPFSKRYLYYNNILVDRPSLYTKIFPATQDQSQNRVIILSDTGHRSPFSVLMTDCIPDYHALASTDGFQCFPFYVYDEDGSNQGENITDQALARFQSAYGEGVTKYDIFYYVYGILHLPIYRARYAENLKRELPRMPRVPIEQFGVYVSAGQRLAELHLNYEQAPEYRLQWIENRDIPFTWRVNKMRLSTDKTRLIINEALTLAGIPLECFRYRLGNRSALEWIIDQYQVSTDKRSGIVSDPNRSDDEEYIVRLVGRVITVSIETMKIVDALPAWE